MKKEIAILCAVMFLLHALAGSAAAPVSADNEEQISGFPLPEKILSTYAGYWLDQDSVEKFCPLFIEPMKEAGFNTADFKLLPPGFNLSDPDQKENLNSLVEAVHSRGMRLRLYVVSNPYAGRRDPEKHAHLPAFVNENGKVIEDKFSLIHWPAWELMYSHAFKLAEISKDLGIGFIGVDLETLMNQGISYDDAAWKRFCKTYQQLNIETEAPGRVDELQKHDLQQEYEEWFRKALGDIAVQYRERIHQENPSLILGLMPSVNNWFYNAFVANLATKEVPAIIDSWLMYNGERFNERVLKEQKRIKALNPNNLYVLWYRINSYHPEDLTIQSYYSIMNTDGYSSWTILMLGPDGPLPEMYKLPGAYSPDDYWAAFEKIHDLVKRDLSDDSGKRLIDNKPVTPLAPKANFDLFDFQEFVPAGTGKGEPGWMVLRNQQVIYIYAEAGENIHAEIRHLAGDRRPIALYWAVLDKNKKILQDETITPGSEKNLEIAAPETGTYALVVTGGEGGQAWYGVKVHNQHAGLLASYAKDEAGHANTYLFFEGSVDSMDYWLARRDMESPAQIELAIGKDQMFEVQLDGKKATGIEKEKVTFSIPPAEVIKMTLNKPDNMLDGMYCQDIWLKVTGAAEPLLFDGPQRRLRKKQPLIK
jgi:hypothetical protein